MKLLYVPLAFLAALALHAQTSQDAPAGQLPGTQTATANDCAASGTVINSVTGEPIPRAMVTLGGPVRAGLATDAAGRWSISNTACGVRFPDATRPGFVRTSSGTQGAAGRQKIELLSGSPLKDVKIVLTPEGLVSGTVLDANGDPVNAVELRILRVIVRAGRRMLANNDIGFDNPFNNDVNSDINVVPSVDPAGNFRVRLVPGVYIVCANSPALSYPVGGGEALSYGESCYPGPVASGLSNAMRVEAGREIRIAFTLTAVPGVHVRGRISGVPVATPGGRAPTVRLFRNRSTRWAPQHCGPTVLLTLPACRRDRMRLERPFPPVSADPSTPRQNCRLTSATPMWTLIYQSGFLGWSAEMFDLSYPASLRPALRTLAPT